MINAPDAFKSVLSEVSKHVAGNKDILELMFIAMVADGHVLLEGVPGVAKTTMTRTLAETVTADFGRIEGTSDLQIRDVVGYTYIDDQNNLQLKKGPIFTNLLLIDELNRAPPQTTTSMLQALEEKMVTLGGSTLPLKKPFIAFATQNPLNIEGTIPLPKVLTDRFLMRIGVNYADIDVEEQMLRIKEREEELKVNKVLNTDDIIALQQQAKAIEMSDEVAKYITQVVHATRTDIHVVMGGSPRSEISFMRAGKAKALIEGRKSVSIDDIKSLARSVLGHRIVVKSTGGLGVNGIIDGIIATLH
jgi:MoxR-like ATPase